MRLRVGGIPDNEKPRPSAEETFELQEGSRKAQQVTIDKLAKELNVEAGELVNKGGVTILEERESNIVREIKQNDTYTLDMTFETTRLDEPYRLILEGWDDWGSSRGSYPSLRRSSVGIGSWNSCPG